MQMRRAQPPQVEGEPGVQMLTLGAGLARVDTSVAGLRGPRKEGKSAVGEAEDLWSSERGRVGWWR